MLPSICSYWVEGKPENPQPESLSSSLLSKNLKIRIYKIVTITGSSVRNETWTLKSLREEHRNYVYDIFAQNVFKNKLRKDGLLLMGCKKTPMANLNLISPNIISQSPISSTLNNLVVDTASLKKPTKNLLSVSPKIQLVFKTFKLDKPNDCESNFIDIFSPNTEVKYRVRKFCSSMAEIVSSNNSILYVRYYADKKARNSTFSSVFTAFREVKKEGDRDPVDLIKMSTHMPNLESGHKRKNFGGGEFDPVLWIGLRRSSMVRALVATLLFPACLLLFAYVLGSEGSIKSSVDGIGDSEMVFGDMRPRIRHRLPDICLIGKTSKKPNQVISPKRNRANAQRNAELAGKRATV
ncbi:hypothetical protein ANN_18210 [Periplaneta americana]|uniref:CUB domain-containing protein n=1 Tax=Periplaneta americana TaxID=6978 RepID=A0ABQ8SN45_PERAM|nr:hypothetical protein ANN_18210 [Periplaneta americana]